VAALVAAFGDIELAEDSVQEAFAVAVAEWRPTGMPPNPGGWITTTARRRAIDRLRRETRGRELLGTLQPLSSSEEESTLASGEAALKDERLRLIFTCCHPALANEAQVALTLRLLGGLSISEVARSFLVGDAAMTQRLVRAKRKIKAARIPYRVPDEHELPERLRSVLTVVYLVYNAGLSRHDDPDLCLEAVRLARILRSLMPDEEEVAGLLGLVLLVESRRSSRTRRDGSFVPLEEQDRRRWNRNLIEEGQALVRCCLQRNRPGPYQIQAAINAVHTDAATVGGTDWRQIVALYDQLFAFSPTPVVALNRAAALAEVEGPDAALPLVEELDLVNYYAFHAVRADLLHRLGRDIEAEAAYAWAATLAPTGAESEFLRRGGRGTSE
jgi:RNA polymerase sigma-70 factor (ECF subfamily)